MFRFRLNIISQNLTTFQFHLNIISQNLTAFRFRLNVISQNLNSVPIPSEYYLTEPYSVSITIT
jgi:flagellar basal body rod protein FlgC